ncbi:type 1 glutamine amidotransferase [Roseobacteraceae bacterium NS-SX3]
MHLAILVTNTDDSVFAAAHPRDGEKFTRLIHMARPRWRCSAFEIKDGEFPKDIAAFDGALITGSPASARSGLPWIAPLLELIRGMHRRRQPLFGACFGHQAIALALGGAIGRNPDGWVHGLTRNRRLHDLPWTGGLPEEVKLYGSHSECVTALPPAAIQTAESGGLVSGFAIGRHIWTTQHHPEMSHGFITALTEEMRETLGPEAHAQALASLEEKSDQAAFAEALARFVEQGTRG